MTSRHIDPTTLASFSGAAAGQSVGPLSDRANRIYANKSISDGVLSDASGDLVIKPCTPAEVAFYEDANASHPEFAFYLPKFMGTLQLGDRTPAVLPVSSNNSAVAGLEIAETKAIDLPITHAPSTSIPPPTITPTISDVRNISTLSATHAPSLSVPATGSTLGISDPGPLKGKKLDTDLHIVLENVSAGFAQPNILDLKLGSRLWDDDAKPEKRARLDKVASETTSGSLGFRIAGMRVWQGDAKDAPSVEKLEDVIKGDDSGSAKQSQHWSLDETSNHKSYNKFYGRTFDADNVLEGFREYFLVPSAGITEDHARIVIWNFLSELKDIEQILQGKESRMYSASLLFVYEGDPDAFKTSLDAISNAPEPKPRTAGEVNEDEDDENDDNEEDEGEDRPKVHAVKLIDFAHARFGEGLGPDENMLAGVRSAIRVLETLLKEISA